MPAKKLVIHHTALEGAVQLDRVNKAHKRRGYDKSNLGYHVAYHYFVGSDGTVVQTRSPNERTMHTRNDESNYGSISIVLAGDFSKHDVPEAQKASLKRLIQKLNRVYQFEEITGHNEESPTSCPGAYLEEYLRSILGDSYTDDVKTHTVDSRAKELTRITSYNPEVAQNDHDPCKSSVGVDICHFAKEIPIVAVSQDLVSKNYASFLMYGDFVRVTHDNPACNYEGVVLDVMNERYKDAVDIFRMDKSKNHGLCRGGTIQRVNRPGFYDLYPNQIEFAPSIIKKHYEKS